MGVYLPNMEMPKGRPVCIVIDAAGQARRYDLNNDRYTDKELFETVYIPSHGDLIDQDEYRDEFMNGVYALCGNDSDNYRANAIIDLFDAAPTIIPASGVQEDE